jgi:hypothetical protein
MFKYALDPYYLSGYIDPRADRRLDIFKYYKRNINFFTGLATFTQDRYVVFSTPDRKWQDDG